MAEYIVDRNGCSGVCDEYTAHVHVDRPIYTQQDFNQKYGIDESMKNANEQADKAFLGGLRRRIRNHVTPVSTQCVKKTASSFFPFIQIMSEYNIRNDLLSDIMSGLIVGIMHIPQGMAYGMLTKLDPVYGLYASFFPVILYFFLGTSKHISIGTFAVVCLMIGKVVDQSDCSSLDVHGNSTQSFNTENYSSVESLNSSLPAHLVDGLSDYRKCQIGVAMALSFVVGIIQIVLGLLRFGFVTVYLSDPLTRALTMAAAVHVATSQVKHVFGIEMGRFSGPLKLIYMYVTLFKNIIGTNIAAVVTCIIAMIIIYSVQRWISPRVMKLIRMPLPIELIVIIISTLISHFVGFDEKFKMTIVGRIPTGIPSPTLPSFHTFPSVFGDAIGIAIVSFTINISMAKLFAKKHHYHLDSNQELMAYGIANSACSMLNCFVSTASLSRSLVQESAGGKTQIAGLVSCSVILVVLLAIAPLFYSLPKCILAAIILVNLKGVFMQITDLKKLYKSAQYYDLVIWIVTATAVILTDVDIGLYIGIGFSLLTVVFRSQSPRTSILGRIPNTDLYEDIKTYPLSREIPGIKIFRFSSSLYYGNTEHIVSKLYEKTGCNPSDPKLRHAHQKDQLEKGEITLDKDIRKNKGSAEEVTPQSSLMHAKSELALKDDVPGVKCVILDFSSVVFIDYVGVSALKQVMKDYEGIGINVQIACCQEDVYVKLKKAGVVNESDVSGLFLQIHDAVLAASDPVSFLQQQIRMNRAYVLSPIFDVLLEAANVAIGNVDEAS